MPIRPPRLRRSAVNIFTIADGENYDQKPVVVNFKNDAEITYSKPVTVISPSHFLNSLAARIFGELFERFIDSELELAISNFT